MEVNVKQRLASIQFPFYEIRVKLFGNIDKRRKNTGEHFCHGEKRAQATRYAMPVIGIDGVAQHAPIQSLLEISTRQIFQSSCGEFGTTKDMDQVELKALWLREEQHMDEEIFKDSECYKHASEITLPALVHWHSIRFTCSRCVDNGIPYVQATKEIQSTPDEIVVEIAAKPPLAGTAKVVKINATEIRTDTIMSMMTNSNQN